MAAECAPRHDFRLREFAVIVTAMLGLKQRRDILRIERSRDAEAIALAGLLGGPWRL
jgi:hypothetical protein